MTDSAQTPTTSPLIANLEKILAFVHDSGNTPPRMGADVDPPEVRVSREDGAVVVWAKGDEVIGFDFSEPIRLSPIELGEVLVEAVNDALRQAREAALAGTEGMPDMAEVQANVESMQREALAAYRAEIDRITAPLRGMTGE